MNTCGTLNFTVSLKRGLSNPSSSSFDPEGPTFTDYKYQHEIMKFGAPKTTVRIQLFIRTISLFPCFLQKEGEQKYPLLSLSPRSIPQNDKQGRTRALLFRINGNALPLFRNEGRAALVISF